jgi:ribosomal protein S15P/S13E
MRVNLTNREITSEADLEALLEEIKQRLQEHLQRNERIRIT